MQIWAAQAAHGGANGHVCSACRGLRGFTQYTEDSAESENSTACISSRALLPSAGCYLIANLSTIDVQKRTPTWPALLLVHRLTHP